MTNHDPYFVQTMDATGRLGLSTEQKLTCAMRMLTYGLPANLCDEFLDIAESTALEVLDHFTRAIWVVYHKDYLCTPTKADLVRLTNKAADRGFPGSLNDINVLGMSPLFDEVCRGEAPQVNFKVANSTYHQGYYLVDRIYPNWATLVKAIKNPTTPETKHFTRMQEAFRKDVERAFGILQARFPIVRSPARLWDRESLQYIMMTCIILHNMIVEDERDEDEQYEFDIDEILTRPKKAEIYDKPRYDDEKHRNLQVVQKFVRGRYKRTRCPVICAELRSDLVQHG